MREMSQNEQVMSKKIQDIAGLDREIIRLTARKQQLESNLDQNFGKLRKNYGSMVMNAVFSQFNPASNNIWASLIGRVLDNEKIRSGMNNLVDAVTNKVGDGVNAVSQKLLHKK